MGKLDARGIIAVIEICVYIPLLATSILLILKHGAKRSAGWLFFVIFSIGEYSLSLLRARTSPTDGLLVLLVRVVGATTHIASKLSNSTNTTLHTVYSILESVGLQPLLGATLGFLATMYVLISEIVSSTPSLICLPSAQNGLDSGLIISRGLKLLGLLSTIALALSVAGAVNAGDAKTQDDLNGGTNLRHAGAILFLILYLLIVAMHMYYWANKDRIMKHRRRVRRIQ